MGQDFANFIVAYDFSETADAAADRAINAALRAGTHLLHFVAAIDPNKGMGFDDSDPIDYQYAEKIQERLTEAITARLKAIEPDGEIEFFVHARFGEPAQQILQAAEELGADLIFMGSHGRTGIKRMLIGSVSEKVVREAQCPVMVVRQKGYPDVELEKVVAVKPDDGSKGYVAPHRYSYRNAMVQRRPDAWPLN
ncbi:MAG: universal stress protein [Deltaproteobacteria bacterium]|nr:universal stress protein [Deltaproteobacteria bacterium]